MSKKAGQHYETIAVRQYGKLLYVKRRLSPDAPNNVGGQRGAVTGFSARSRVRMRRYLSSCVADYRVMLTLTYAAEYPQSGATCKDQLRRFIQEIGRYIRRSVPGSRPSVFWFLEFQKRGAPHFHLFCTHEVPKRVVANIWGDIVDADDDKLRNYGTRIEAIRGGRHGIIAYASKYALKEEQKKVPIGFQDVGRFWGVSGNRKTVAATTIFTRKIDRSGEKEHTERKRTTIGGRLKTMVDFSKQHGKVLATRQGFFIMIALDSDEIASVVRDAVNALGVHVQLLDAINGVTTTQLDDDYFGDDWIDFV